METVKVVLKFIATHLSAAIRWVFSHKKIVFVYVPSVIFFIFILYVGYVYLCWRADRAEALQKLARYKRLIDKTEEIRKGITFTSKDVEISPHVVDIPTRIFDRNNEIIGEFFEQKREIVPFYQIPKFLIQAVIASEDREFYSHRGINPKGILRALVMNFLHLRVVQGGSTITQQLAKVLFTDMGRTLKRKIYEMFCALEIERRYDKQDILLMYLNLIYFGNGAYGVEATAKMFFGQGVENLGEVECAMIVATISNPLLYSPLSNLENSIKKTKRILQSMVDANFLTRARADYLMRRFLTRWNVTFNERGVPVSSLIGSFIYSAYRINRAPFFNEQIRRILVDKFGEEVVKKGGLQVYTTIDGQKQDVALKVLCDGVKRERDLYKKRYGKSKTVDEEDIQGALVALDPFTGEIIAYVGGYSFTSTNQLDHVTQIRRQPGSSFKPIIFLAAIEAREINPATRLLDQRETFEGGYSPRNYDNKYYGEVTAYFALAKSLNVVAVRILEKVGYAAIFDFIQKSLDLSDEELYQRFGKTLSLALGSYEISPMEAAILHSVIVNGGDFIKPYGIKVVKDYHGVVIWNPEEEVKEEVMKMRARIGKIAEPSACAVLVSMLRGVFRPEGTAHFTVKNRNLPFPIAGKTGTTSNFNDAWFVGYTADMVTSIWIGNRRGAISLGEGRAAAVIAVPIWINFISQIYRDRSPGNFRIPEEGVTAQSMCLESGALPTEHACKNVVSDLLFVQGSEPTTYCELHRQENVDANAQQENKDDQK
ncbi:MAG: transglycosylase domain-containing protein [Spirochaetes bacterium]|nr:transglycosylase domain-containing protein [Spirochaetota bacterium]